MKCIKCNKELSADEIAIYKRLINRGAESFECKECLAATLKVEVSEIDRKIDFFRRHGCTLFN
ncbi:MAG: hypothetical protein IJZ93_00860 [Clostridia bacterium]|nr:hypothetical protein [Clostridia bacterium]MBQ8605209.1 hypothetical protein [Clostridia bacterium]